MRRLLIGLGCAIAVILMLTARLFALEITSAGNISAPYFHGFSVRAAPKAVPTISATTNPLTMSTTYGLPSTSTFFKLSGTDLSEGILVTPPAGFEVSTDNFNFANSVTVGGAGNVLLTNVYVRIKATTNAGNYAGNITLSSAGAADVLVPITNTVVRPRIMNVYGQINKYYGDDIPTEITLYYNTPGFTFTNPGLVNGEEFNSLHFSFSAGNNVSAIAGTYANTITLSDYTGRNGFLSSNYAITYQKGNFNVLPAPLTITTNDVNKLSGTSLSNVVGSANFNVMGLKNGETVGKVNISYGTGAATVAPEGTFKGQVIISSAAGGSFNPANYSITYVAANLIVGPPAPFLSSTDPSAVNTLYGTPSLPGSFDVSGGNLSAPIVITPPPGFELSTDNINFSNSVTIGAAGTVSPKRIYIRLAAKTDVGGYSGNILLASGVTTQNVIMPNSIVSPAPLTIAGNNASKSYGSVLTTYTGTDNYTITVGALKNGETISSIIISYGLGAAATDKVGTYPGSVQPGAITGGNGFKITNYNVSYKPAGIIVQPHELYVSANPVSKTYGALLQSGTGPNSFTVSGLQNGENVGTVTINYVGGAARGDSPGVYTISATPSAVTGGTFTADDYLISYLPADVTVTPAALTIIADDESREFGTDNPVLTISYSGFVNNEGPGSLVAVPVATTTAVITSPAGKYTITPAGASSPNYTFNYVNGALSITPKPSDPIIINNAFTPNGDGTNDKWEIPALVLYPKCKVYIYNRYGQTLYSSIGYNKPWDGRYNNHDVPTGVFYYLINLNDGTKPLAGSLTVLR